MKLKEKILIKAVELFNEQGISSTSPNQIAAALGISPGNLTYHYPTKATLVKAVYERMHDESKDIIQLTGYQTLEDFRQIMRGFRDFMGRYSFFFQDVFFILQKYPEVGRLYQESNYLRLRQGRALFAAYVETGRMIPERHGINYDHLVHNVWMVGAFWHLQSKVFAPGTLFDPAMDMVEMTWYMLLPYLTEQGREEYERVNEGLRSKV